MNRNEMFTDLAARLRLAADDAYDEGWASTAQKLHTAAGSLEWQLRWNERHPEERP